MKNTYITLVLIHLFVVVSAQAEIIFVDDGGLADFNNIQAAIGDSNDEDVIVVFPGRYTGTGNRNIDFRGKAITVQSVDPEDPYIVSVTIVDCEGSGRGFIFDNEEDERSVLNGLTITNGNAGEGGGIFCNGFSPTITNCRIIGNYAEVGGGVFGCRGKVMNCSITDNIAFYAGGGLAECSGVSNCVISNNSAEGEPWDGLGGGLYACSGVHSCLITGNTSLFGSGGGLASCYGIESCIITGNSAGQNGGGVFDNAAISNCTITNNTAGFSGGGVSNDYSIIANCILWGNRDSGPSIEQAQIHNSEQVEFSCIEDDDPNDMYVPFGGADSNNIDDNPMFFRDANDGGDGWGVGDNDDYGDQHLRSGSPCINVGDAYAWFPPGSMDIDGQSRVMRYVVDIGADEFYMPTIVVIRPLCGEVWTNSGWHEIAWESDADHDAVDILLSTNGGDNWETIESSFSDTGSYVWHLPVSVDSNQCLISVVPSIPDANTVSISSGSFTIHTDSPGPLVTSKWKSLGGDYHRAGLSEYWGPELGCVSWSFETGSAISASVTIGPNDTVYVPCEDGNLYNLDSNGILQWTCEVNAPLMSSASLGPDGTAYVGDKNGKLTAIDADGNVRWTHQTGGFVYSSAAVSQDGNNVYVCSQDGKLYAISNDGSEIWSLETQGLGLTGGAILGSPSIGNDGTVFVAGLYDANLYAIDPNDGNIKWVCHFESEGWPFASPVIADDGTVYQTLLYDPNLYAISTESPNAGNIIWSKNLSDTDTYLFEPNGFHSIRYTEDGCVYIDADYNDVGDSVWSEPVLGPDGTIYVSLDDPYLRALDSEGNFKWVTKLGTMGNFSLTVASNGFIYAVEDGGYLYVVDSNGRKKARFESENWPGLPVIAGNNAIIVADSKDNSPENGLANNKVWKLSGEGCSDNDRELYWYGIEDLTGDGTVDGADIAVLAADWLRCTDCSDTLAARACRPFTTMMLDADVNRDFYVNFLDFALLAEVWLIGH